MKYQKTFRFFGTKDQADRFAADYKRTATAWQKKRYPAAVTPWISMDGKEKLWLVWYSF